MTDQSDKPREWFIKEAFVGYDSGTKYPAHVTSDLSYGNYEGGMIHVIEYSRYQALSDNCISLFLHETRMKEVEDKLAKAEAELEAWKTKCVYMGEIHESQAFLIKSAEKERDEAKAEIETYNILKWQYEKSIKLIDADRCREREIVCVMEEALLKLRDKVFTSVDKTMLLLEFDQHYLIAREALARVAEIRGDK